MQPRSRHKRKRLFLAAFGIPAALILSALLVIGLDVRQESLNRELIAAIMKGRTQEAIALLNAGADANAREADTLPRTLLQMVKDFLHGKRPIPPSKDSLSALALAVERDNTEIVQALFAHHATGVNERMKELPQFVSEALCPCALFRAVQHGNFTMTEMLLDHGALINPQEWPSSGAINFAFDPLANKDSHDAPIHYRQTLEDVRKMVKMLVGRGAYVKTVGTDGETGLDKAAKFNDDTLVDFLLARGAFANQGSGNDGALNYAIQNSNLKMARTLLHHGASIRTEDLGHEVLIIDAPDLRTLRFVVAHGADINALQVHGNYEGETRLAMSALDGDLEEMRLLVSLGADANKAGQEGPAPLMQASSYATPVIIELLLTHGAKVNARTSVSWPDGWTALMFASKEGKDKNIDCLLQHGADPNQRNGDKQTALMLAVHNGHEAAVKELLEGGASVNLRDKDGQTALDYADGNTPVIALIKRWGGRSGKR